MKTNAGCRLINKGKGIAPTVIVMLGKMLKDKYGNPQKRLYVLGLLPYPLICIQGGIPYLCNRGANCSSVGRTATSREASSQGCGFRSIGTRFRFFGFFGRSSIQIDKASRKNLCFGIWQRLFEERVHIFNNYFIFEAWVWIGLPQIVSIFSMAYGCCVLVSLDRN